MFRNKTWLAMIAFSALVWCAALQGRPQGKPADPAPTVTLSPSSVPFDRRESVHVFTAEVRTPGETRLDSGYTVELTLYGPRGRRTIALKSAGAGKYNATAQLLEEQPRTSKLRVSVTLPDNGIVAGEIDDLTVKTLGRPIKLSEIARHEYQNVILLTSGERVGAIVAPAPAVFDIAGTRMTVDLAKALRIEVSSGPRTITQVAYMLSVRKGKDEISRSEGVIALTGGAAATAPASAPVASEMLGRSQSRSMPPIVPPQLAAERVEVKLQAPADNIVVGAGGRYLFIELHAAQRIAVFDVNTAQITRYLAMPSANFRVAAGADKLIVLLPDLGVVQRWNLATMERETSSTLEAADAYAVALGHASAGPVLVLGRRGRVLYDLDTLKRLPEPRVTGSTNSTNSTNSAPWMNMNAPYETRASADGATFTAFDAGRTVGFASTLFFTLEEGLARDRFQGEVSGAVLPSHDGSVFFTGSGILTSELKFIAPDRLRNAQFLPSTSPAFFLGVAVPAQQATGFRGRGQTQPSQPSIDVYLWEDKRVVVSVPAPELTPPQTPRGNAGATILPVERKVFLIPDANLLVTLAPERDTLIVRKLDVDAELKKGGDYLYVESLPARTARRGERYQYSVKARSKSGGVEYKLESGPAGMNIDGNGAISWDVPAKATAESPVIVSIQDRAGQSALHAFTILTR